MSPRIAHPTWCTSTRCGIKANGVHESEPVRVTSGRGRGVPRFLASLTQARSGPIRLHLIIVGDMIINDISVDVDTAHLLLASLSQLIDLAQPNG
jgi:hypothetical protein